MFRSDTSGTLTTLYDTNTIVPGGAGGTFTVLGRPATSDGRIAFWGGNSEDGGIYSDISGQLEAIVNQNTPVPGFPGQTFSGTFRGGPVQVRAIDNGRVMHPGPAVFRPQGAGESVSFTFAGLGPKSPFCRGVYLEWRTPAGVKVTMTKALLKIDYRYTNPTREVGCA